ncbi:MAG: polysaccharide biosynthesis C-terminal domain-containing protein [Candidatus Eisenbacteria bacterium]|nr:polysaccharide biosynthesis C-terminal domain-containing protein [Candidatus Eisenbacteria bacterium]
MRTWTNVASNWAFYILNIGVAFYLSPFMVRMLGDSQFGAWNILVSLTGYMGLVDLGVRSAVVKYAAEYWTKKDYARLTSQFYSSFLSLVIGGSALLIVALAVRDHLALWLHIGGSLGEPFAASILPSALAVIFSIGSGLISGYMYGVGRYDISNLAGTITLVLRTTGIVLVLSRGGGLPELAWVVAITAILSCPVSFLMLRPLIPSLRFSTASFSLESWLEVVRYGLFAFLAQIAARVSQETGNIIVGVGVSTTATAYYAIGLSLAGYLRAFTSSAAVVAIPLTSGMAALKDMAGTRRVTILGTRFAVGFALCGFVSFFFLGRDFLLIWLGERFAANTWPTGLVLLLALVFLSAQQFSYAMLFGRGKAKLPAFAMVASAIANVLLGVFLVHRVGAIGVALGSLIPAAVIEFGFISCYFAPKELGTTRLSYLKQTWVGPLICVFPCVLSGLLARSLVEVSDFPRLIQAGLFLLGGYFIPAWWICLEKEERTSIGTKVTTQLRRVATIVSR